MRKTIIIILLTLTMSSCYPSGKEVAGKYYASHTIGIEYIELFEDGSFFHYFKNDSVAYQEEGKWYFKLQLRQQKLVLSGYVRYVTPSEKGVNPWERPGSASIYWKGDRLYFFGDGYDEYNYYRRPE